MPGFASSAAFVLTLSIAGGAVAQTTPTPSPAGTPRFEYPRQTPNTFADVGLARLYQSPNVAFIESYREMIGYGRCATNVSPEYAGRFLNSEPSDPRGRAAARRLVGLSRGCLPLGSHVPMDFLRLGLAEVGYHRTLAAGAPLPQPTLQPLPKAEANSFAAAATCLAYRAPQATYRVMATAPGSDAEREALIGAFAATPQCGRIGPVALRELPALRGHLAIAAYRSVTRS